MLLVPDAMFKPSTCLLAASVLLVVSMGMGVESIGEQKLNRKLSARLIPDPQDKQAQTEVSHLTLHLQGLGLLPHVQTI